MIPPLAWITKSSKLISNDEPICPYCGTARPGAFWKGKILGGFSLLYLNPVAVTFLI